MRVDSSRTERTDSGQSHDLDDEGRGGWWSGGGLRFGGGGRRPRAGSECLSHDDDGDDDDDDGDDGDDDDDGDGDDGDDDGGGGGELVDGGDGRVVPRSRSNSTGNDALGSGGVGGRGSGGGGSCVGGSALGQGLRRHSYSGSEVAGAGRGAGRAMVVLGGSQKGVRLSSGESSSGGRLAGWGEGGMTTATTQPKTRKRALPVPSTVGRSRRGRSGRVLDPVLLSLVEHLLFSGFNLLLVVAVGTVAFSWFEDKPWYEALYFSVVSVTTVGYGDELCTSSPCKLFSVAYLLVGCLFTAGALADIAAFPVELRRRAHEMKVLRQYGDKLSQDDLEEITTQAAAIFGGKRKKEATVRRRRWHGTRDDLGGGGGSSFDDHVEDSEETPGAAAAVSRKSGAAAEAGDDHPFSVRQQQSTPPLFPLLPAGHPSSSSSSPSLPASLSRVQVTDGGGCGGGAVVYPAGGGDCAGRVGESFALFAGDGNEDDEAEEVDEEEEEDDDDDDEEEEAEECTREQFTLVMLLKLKKITSSDLKACSAQFDRLDLNRDGALNATDVALSDAARQAKREARCSRRLEKEKRRRRRQQQQQQGKKPSGFVAGGH